MIILDSITDSLEIDLTSVVTTNQLPFVAAYQDVSQSTFAMSAVSGNDGTTNNTTAVTLVAAPGASTSRILKYLSVKNSDTVATELWIQLNANATLREIWKGTLAVGDTLEYIDTAGWKVLNNSGQIKTAFSASGFTSTQVAFAGTNGILTGSSGFTFNTTGNILTVDADTQTFRKGDSTIMFVLSGTAGASRIVDGLRIGADSTNNLLDDASNGAGSATLYIGNASITVSSDELLKSEIQPLKDGLSIVRKLLPIEFDQDKERPFGDVRHYMGFGARHSHKVAPWTVHTQGNTGLPWKMRQEFLMAPVVRAIQQLDERLTKAEVALAVYGITIQ